VRLESSPLDFTELTRSPGATLLWGESRAVVNRVLFAMVRSNDRDPFWIQVVSSADEDGHPTPLDLRWIPKERAFVIGDPDELKPHDAIANMALAALLAEETSPTSIIADFLRLPGVTQELIGGQQGASRARAVGFANADLVRKYYRSGPRDVEPLLQAMVGGGLLPFFGSTTRPGPGQWAFDHSFEVRAPSLDRWREGRIVCEKAPTSSPWHVGAEVPLAEIRPAAAALSGSGPDALP
jgi:hypothetical protein